MMRYWLLILALVSGAASAGMASGVFRSFSDDSPFDNVWDDYTTIVVGDGGFTDPYESLPEETAQLIIKSEADQRRRVVIEIDLDTEPVILTSELWAYFDFVYPAAEIEIYGYAGDGVLTADDADITGKQYITSIALDTDPFDTNRQLKLLSADTTAFTAALKASAERWAGFVLKVKDEATTTAYAGLWTGEVAYSRTNRAGPQIAAKCVPQCPEDTVDRAPTIREYGDYPSDTYGVCTHLAHEQDVAIVTLNDGEALDDAMDRLNAMDAVDGVIEGGILEVPWNAVTTQCDTLRVDAASGAPNDGTHKVTIRGTLGPNGERPSWYCRLIKGNDGLTGTIDDLEQPGPWLTIGAITNRQVAVENVIVDGYTDIMKLPNQGKFKLLSSYVHHGFGDGFANSNALQGTDSLEIAFCGNELSHTGSGNTQHVMYIHRGYYSEVRENRLYVLDNYIHSCRYSSCVKSIAEYNTIVGNTFRASANNDGIEDDAGFNTEISHLLIDIPSCGYNLIKNNFLEGYKDDPSGGGNEMVGIRNRAGDLPMAGCDKPVYGTIYQDPKTGDDQIDTSTPNPYFFSDEYWDSLAGGRPFETIVENNTVQLAPRPENLYGDRIEVWSMYGTHPNEAATLGLSFWLQAPTQWYERSIVKIGNNTYTGIAPEMLYHQAMKGDCINPNRGCPYEDPVLTNQFPLGEDTTAPYPAGAQEVCVDILGDANGVCGWGPTPALLYSITGPETVQ